MEPGAEVPDDGRPDDFVQSVGRAVRVLEVVGREPGLPVKAIARKCELNISTSYHLVRTLAYEGYLVRLPNGTYVIGESVARRFHDLVTSLGRPPEAAVVLRQLSERVGLSSYLGLLHEERVTVVEVAEAAGSPYLEDFEVGLDVSAHATALGKALLVGMPPRQRHRFLASHELRPFTSRTRTDVEALEAELRLVRPDAPVSEHGEFRDGVSCTATLVPRQRAQDPAWAVVVAVADEEVSERIAAEVTLAAADLAGSVGR
ncbi:MAG: helix-turn-helix domain-containing protein [Nocardioidaceae bacterium]|nr:helix-turn-helix domain-containing protein [Nocardioidaceae bacterium]NUS50332.1 helix-turn-helix domain-containing protein [Nocardioidaceae bacterium]